MLDKGRTEGIVQTEQEECATGPLWKVCLSRGFPGGLWEIIFHTFEFSPPML